MRVESTSYDGAATYEGPPTYEGTVTDEGTAARARESSTKLYVKPAPARPTVRSFEIADQHAMPVLPQLAPPPSESSEPSPVAQASPPPVPQASRPSPVPRASRRSPAPRPSRNDRTHAVRRASPNLLPIAFAALCIVVGITIGALIASGGSQANTAPVVPVVSSPTITPINPAPPAVRARHVMRPAQATAPPRVDRPEPHVTMINPMPELEISTP